MSDDEIKWKEFIEELGVPKMSFRSTPKTKAASIIGFDNESEEGVVTGTFTIDSTSVPNLKVGLNATKEMMNRLVQLKADLAGQSLSAKTTSNLAELTEWFNL